jgi:hypothetical protein
VRWSGGGFRWKVILVSFLYIYNKCASFEKSLYVFTDPLILGAATEWLWVDRRQHHHRGREREREREEGKKISDDRAFVRWLLSFCSWLLILRTPPLLPTRVCGYNRTAGPEGAIPRARARVVQHTQCMTNIYTVLRILVELLSFFTHIVYYPVGTHRH